MAAHQPAHMRLDLEDAAPGQVELLTFDPRVHWEGAAPTDLKS